MVTIDERTQPAAPEPAPPPPPIVDDPPPTTPAWGTWDDAYAERLRHQDLVGFLLSGVGAASSPARR